MPVDQTALSLMIAYAPDDLDMLQKQYNQIVSSIATQTDLQTLYQSMMDKAKADLEYRLETAKLPLFIGAWQPSYTYIGADILPPGDYVRSIVYNNYVYECTVGGVSGLVEPVFPTIIGNTVTESTGVEWTCSAWSDLFSTGVGYNVTNLSAWSIVDKPGGTDLYSPTVSWDSDVLLIRYMTDWGIIWPLIYNPPFGTTPMLVALGIALGIISTRKNEIAARNTILIHFTTPLIYATAEPGGGRTITPSGIGGEVYVDYGKNQTFIFGGTVNYVVVDGVNLGLLPNYTFINVIAEHSIKVY